MTDSEKVREVASFMLTLIANSCQVIKRADESFLRGPDESTLADSLDRSPNCRGALSRVSFSAAWTNQ